MFSALLVYLTISYIVGVGIFVADCILAPTGLMFHALFFRLGLVVLSPLTAWHGALHWGQILYRKLSGKPLKFWV